MGLKAHKALTNLMISLLAIAGIVIGTASMVTPIPGGTLLIALSLSALVYANVTARTCVMWLRFHNTRFDDLIAWLTTVVGTRINFIGQALAKTTPTFSWHSEEIIWVKRPR